MHQLGRGIVQTLRFESKSNPVDSGMIAADVGEYVTNSIKLGKAHRDGKSSFAQATESRTQWFLCNDANHMAEVSSAVVSEWSQFLIKIGQVCNE